MANGAALPDPGRYRGDAEEAGFLGVPPDFTGREIQAEGPAAPLYPTAVVGGVERRAEGPPLPGGQPPPTFTIGAPVWKDGDQNVLLSMSPEAIWERQQALVEVGLLSGPFRKGLPDDKTVDAYRALLGWSNRLGTGRNLSAALEQLALRPETSGGGDEGEFAPEPYLAPNYEQLTTDIRKLVERELGREPDDYEVQQLAETFGGFDRMAHEREQELAQIRARREQGEDVPLPDEAPPDPSMLFANRFEELYSGELDFIEDKESAVEQRQAVQMGTGLVSQAARGGR